MKRIPLYAQILAAMALGATLGLSLNAAGAHDLVSRELVLQLASVGEWAGKVFLALLSMVVVPLIFTSLVSSITQVGEGGGLGRLGLRTVAYYLSTSALAITTGMVVVNLIRPGTGLDYEALMVSAHSEADARGLSMPHLQAADSSVGVLVDVFTRMVPTNVVEAASSNTTILAIIFFAVVFGIATVRTGGKHADLISRIVDAVFHVMMRLTTGLLTLAPVGILGYVFYVTAATGLALVQGLAWYMLAVFLALVIHAGVTLPLILWLVGRRNPLAYARSLAEALTTAFSTASSSATLPVTMRCVRDAGVPDRVVSFTLPLGATVNMDGTALYEAIAVLFVAQMLGDLSLGQQVIVAVTALLASVGAAGIPHAGTVMMVIVMQAVGLPTDAVLVILAVDRVLDMLRTAVNVWSDSVGAAVVARFEEAG